MSKNIEYTDAPEEVKEFLKNAVVVPNFAPTPEEINDFVAKKTKKPVSIYLSVDTIEKFKDASKKVGSRYQTMISNVLDTYTQRYL